MHFNQAPFALCTGLAKLWVNSQPLLMMLPELYLRRWWDPCRDARLLGALTAQAWICLPCSFFLVCQQHRHGVLRAAKCNGWAGVGGSWEESIICLTGLCVKQVINRRANMSGCDFKGDEVGQSIKLEVAF